MRDRELKAANRGDRDLKAANKDW